MRRSGATSQKPKSLAWLTLPRQNCPPHLLHSPSELTLRTDFSHGDGSELLRRVPTGALQKKKGERSCLSEPVGLAWCSDRIAIFRRRLCHSVTLGCSAAPLVRQEFTASWCPCLNVSPAARQTLQLREDRKKKRKPSPQSEPLPAFFPHPGQRYPRLIGYTDRPADAPASR